MKDEDGIATSVFFVVLAIVALCVIAFDCGRAHAQTDNARAFGDRAWIADKVKAHYKAVTLGDSNLEHIPLAYREYFIRDTLQWTGCLVSHEAVTDWTPQDILARCDDPKVEREWWGYFFEAARDSFPPEYGGQTALAILPVQAMLNTCQLMIRKVTREDARRGVVFKKHAVPSLKRQWAKIQQAQKQLVRGAD